MSLRKNHAPNFSGLWTTESIENQEEFLTACGYNIIARKMASISSDQENAFFFKQKGSELCVSQLRKGTVETTFLRINERTECTLPDGTTGSVRSAWDGNIHVTTDDTGRFETRRWLEAERLVVAETIIRTGEAPVTLRRVLKWAGADPVWGGYSDEMSVLANRTNFNEEDLIGQTGGGICEPVDPQSDTPWRSGIKASLKAASEGARAISHTVGGSLATLETLLVDKPPAGYPDWHSVFGVESKEKLHGAFNCALSGDIAHQGRLYIFDKCIGFFSAIFGRKVRTIRAEDVTDIRKLPGLLPPNAIVIKMINEEDAVFANFLSRDQAYEMLTSILWSFSDEASAKPPPVAVGFQGERYIFVQIHSARGPAGGPVGDHVHDAFVRVRIGQYEARTPTVENSRAPRFNSVCCFPSTMFDPATVTVQVSVLNDDFDGNEVPLGHKAIPMAGIRAAPPLVGNSGVWRAPSSWHKLQMDTVCGQVEASVSMWTANSAHPAFARSTVAVLRQQQQKVDVGLSSRVRVFEEPRMAYLFVEVRQAHGLQARATKVTGMSDPFVHVGCGQQQARTHVVADTLNPVWDDRFTFVVEKPLSTKLMLDIFDGTDSKDSFMGQVVVPLQDVPLRRGNTTSKPKPRWYKIGARRDRFGAIASRVLAGDFNGVPSIFRRRHDGEEADEDEDDGQPRVHMGELELLIYLDSDYMPSQADRRPVGQIAVEIVRARQVERTGELFAVAQYGRSWARLPTSSRDPEWRQELVFPVRDMGEVVTIGIFRMTQAWALASSTEEPIGKARIRPGSLLPGKLYRESLPLFLGRSDGLAETGSLDVMVRFERFSAAATLGRYLTLPMPPKCYIDPPAESTAGVLAQWEEELVEQHLGALEPPLSTAVQRYMRPTQDARLSMRLLRVHVGRLLAAFLTERAAGPSLLDPRVWWRSPPRMAVLHVAFVLLCLFPELAAPSLLLGTAAFGFAGRREVPSFGTDPWLSTGGQFAETTALLKGASSQGGFPGDAPAGDGEGGGELAAQQQQQRLEELATGRLLESVLEEHANGGGGRPKEGEAQAKSLLQPAEQDALFIALGRYARAVESVAERYAVRIEQLLGIFAWRDPLVSRGFFTAMALLAFALFLIPMRSVVLCAGLWIMRHPALRSPSDGAWLAAAFSRLASSSDNIE